VSRIHTQPGSILKLVTAATALQVGVTNSQRRISCPGWMPHPFDRSQRLICWQSEGHGALTLSEALAHSCNLHFYQLGLELGVGRLLAGLQQFDLELPSVGPERVLDLAVGDDPAIQIGPLQLLQLTTQIALQGQSLSTPWGTLPSVNLAPTIWSQLHEGMQLATQLGTCAGIAPPGLEVAAKSGTILRETTRYPHQSLLAEDFQAWLTAFWPAAVPRWALILYLHQGKAYEAAVPLAHQLISHTAPSGQLNLK
jgi:cell division protein FtsI/penicillin-binding protein 2